MTNCRWVCLCVALRQYPRLQTCQQAFCRLSKQKSACDRLVSCHSSSLKATTATQSLRSAMSILAHQGVSTTPVTVSLLDIHNSPLTHRGHLLSSKRPPMKLINGLPPGREEGLQWLQAGQCKSSKWRGRPVMASKSCGKDIALDLSLEFFSAIWYSQQRMTFISRLLSNKWTQTLLQMSRTSSFGLIQSTLTTKICR